MADAARARGLGLRLAVSTMRLGRVAGKWPAAAVRNVLDDVSPERLCPTNPDVVEMVAALVADIADTYAPDAIVLYDFDRGHTGEATAGMENVTDIGPAGDAIMSLCACESCRQGAAGDGVDTDAAIRSARVTLDRALEGRVPGSRTFAGLLSEDAVLRAYVNWQSESLTGALARARERCVTKLVLHRSGGETSGTTDIGRLSRYADGVAVRCPQPGGDDLVLAVESVRSQGVEGGAVEVEFAVTAGGGFRPQSLVADFASAASVGVTTVTVGDLGSLTPTVTDAVKQAIRYARRSASG